MNIFMAIKFVMEKMFFWWKKINGKFLFALKEETKKGEGGVDKYLKNRYLKMIRSK